MLESFYNKILHLVKVFSKPKKSSEISFSETLPIIYIT